MKKLIFAVGLLLFCGKVRGDELRPQYRAWKSSALQSGNYSNVLFSTSPIIFHTVIGSGTANAGTGYFALHRSTGNNGSATPSFIPQVSTKAFIPLDNTQILQDKIGIPWDVFSDSQTFYTKQGGAVVNILWDFYSIPPYFNPFPKD